MASPPPIVALEIGTSRVRALIGEQLDNGQLMITGAGECPSRGVRKGEIIHIENALSCVTKALDMAEEQSHVAIHSVHLVVAGGHIQNLINHGNVPVMSGEITRDDMERAMSIARNLNLEHDRTILHTITQLYYVDDLPGVLDPTGMMGSKLGVDVLILHGIRNRMRNAVKVLRSAHVDVNDVVFGGLCSALAVLTPEQKESGAIVIDMGAGTTDYLVYADRTIAGAGSLAVGGDHINNDIATGLRIPITQAERLKIEWGHALRNQVSPTQVASLQAEGGFPGKNVKLMDLHTIMNARIEETLNLVKAEITRHTPLNMLGAGVLITGGCSHIKGITELAGQIFALPCRVGIPRNISGVAVVTEGPEYAALVGLIRYGFKSARRDQEGSWFGKLVSSIFRG